MRSHSRDLNYIWEETSNWAEHMQENKATCMHLFLSALDCGCHMTRNLKFLPWLLCQYRTVVLEFNCIHLRILSWNEVLYLLSCFLSEYILSEQQKRNQGNHYPFGLRSWNPRTWNFWCENCKHLQHMRMNWSTSRVFTWTSLLKSGEKFGKQVSLFKPQVSYFWIKNKKWFPEFLGS